MLIKDRFVETGFKLMRFEIPDSCLRFMLFLEVRNKQELIMFG